MGFVIPDPRWEEPALLVPGLKPTGPVVIDWEQPLARGLEYYFHINGGLLPQDLVSGSFMSKDSGNDMNPAIHLPFGQALLSTDNDNPYREFPATKPDPTNPLTICLDYELTTDVGKGIFSWADTSKDGSPWILVARDSGEDAHMFVNGTYPSGLAWSTPIGEFQRIIIVFTGSLMTVYVNGISEGTYVTSTIGTNSADNIYIGSGFNQSRYGYYGNVGVYSRAFSLEDVASYTRNPYQFLIPA